MSLRSAVFVLAVAVVLGSPAVDPASPAHATSTRPAGPVLYELAGESRFEWGCFPPCMCPIFLSERMGGTFELTYLRSDPFFDHYAVDHVLWRIPQQESDIIVKGAGTYRVGGEFGQHHQLRLALRVDGHPEQIFDSGVVSGGGEFPVIDIDIAVHAFTCFDTAFSLRALPATAGTPSGGGGFGLRATRPNPFTEQTRIEFAIAQTGRVDLRIYDARGREVKALARGLELGAGPHTVTWDGRREDGRPAAPGIYFARLRGPGEGNRVRSLVKLD